MKITHIVSHFFPRLGGVEKHVLNIALAQKKMGHDVIVITGLYDNTNDYDVIEGIKIYRFPATRSALRMKLWHYIHSYLYFNADILHVHNLMTLNNLPHILIPKRKTVLTLHGWGGVFPTPETKIKSTREGVEKFAGKLITVGEFVNKLYDIKSDSTIYGAISSELLSLKDINDKYFDICIFGRLEHDAGTMIYVSALKKFIERSNYKLKICICGDGSLKEQVLFQLKDEDVTFKGFIEDPLTFVAKSKYCFTSGYLAIMESLALKTKVFSVYDNPIKENYLKLSPFADHIYIAKTTEELVTQLEVELEQKSYIEPQIPKFIYKSTWEELQIKFNQLYNELLK